MATPTPRHAPSPPIGRRTLSLLALAALIAVWGLLSLRPARHRAQGAGGDAVIRRAMQFLKRAQHSSGGFSGRMCSGPGLTGDCVDDLATFYTPFVLHALSFLPAEETRPMRERAVQFLLAAQHSENLWSYWPRDSVRHTWAPPDLDDTACALAALRRAGHPPAEDLDALLRLQTAAGTFWTWVGLPPNANEIDCAVNANVLFALMLEGRTEPRLVRYLNGLVASDAVRGCSSYYSRPEPLYYFIARAYRDAGARDLEPAVLAASDRLLADQQPDGGFGDALTTALAALTWLNAGRGGPPLERALAWLTSHQRRDGGWPAAELYGRVLGGTWATVSFGSESLTTALALEALAKAKAQSNQ